ncbi:arabinose ABC transporter permease [Bradyrhizobium guangdongense]|uniref:MFS transporter n=1 Tax=Bradyrhizobium guangdongense TaxID=1325090 RepID=UPI001126C288|nr:MFS transporter [Bradyrhizobium guangdongense]TPQ27144.1 arabinose ABC transporter permease [Bradyrhizobium guangdongense]
MRSRWGILAILFLVRLTMAFQFQSVAAVAPLLQTQFGVGLADIGLLIGLYFTPGVVLALPGGAIGARVGDKPTALAALALMLIGSLMMALADGWSLQVAGRLVAGIGGVLLSVQLTKMTTDWFAGKEIATAMGIVINSWPTGIALSLVMLPIIGTAGGVEAVFLAVCAVVVVGIVLMLFYRPPPVSGPVAAVTGGLDTQTVSAVMVAGMIWGLFNVGFAMILSFGPTLLVERGWTVAAAGSVISVALWISAFSVPLGGYLADRTQRPLTLLVAGSFALAILLALLTRSSAVVLIVVALGIVSGQPAGPIMSLPARVLAPQNRAIGMGIFLTVFYAAMMLGPVVAGRLASWTGSAAAALDLGAAVVLVCPLLLWLFERIAARKPQPAQA